ncbi:MAG TPA: bacteriohopanetetrol glucosamine biosynthesis glycosyltransferase HpnI [Candidatus Binatus sp.]|uniref:bacteriohopanetetrol glucosamine biosynthesis glycosyltransferase HpnI n=1 Tax=Candidatus Binatus sp. TaxID=2811406 RepID=UPI002B497EFF|nr:bacteriohopanetetrol glucosamine biosynthesis glycosyltransferase HpnI [Candidatus Binatus sp.]HKN14239.1 bacteriohopanetetrol glucosamine biosynthesis glycosyltransferase HpnI [Candidatus Binatus sp.]
MALPAAAVCVSVFYYAAATVAAIRFAKRTTFPLPPIPKVPPRVAVLKPLHGSSNSLAANLVSFLEIAYPRIDFYFGVHNYEDPAAEVPVALRQRYQYANITLVVGEEPDCSNRKIAKLIKMADRSEKAEIFVLSDADVSVERDYLKRIVGELTSDEKIGIVTCAYRARPGGSFASRLEALYVNTDFLPQILLAEMIEPMHYALGATIAIKRKVLEAAGGFRAVKNMLADDFYLGNFTNAQGYEIKLSDSIVTLTCEEKSFAEFWHHQLRWARTYRTVRPISIATILMHGPFWALMLVALSRGSAAAFAALVLVLAARLAMSAAIVSRVLKMPEMLSQLWMVPFKDLIMTGVWFASLFSNKVMWAGRQFKVIRGGAMREV